MLDYKEFFAEMSVTYLCNSYHEYCCGLDNSSNKGSSDNDYILSTTANNNPGRDDTTLLNMETYCPPIIEPNTTARVIEKYNHIYRDRNRFTSNDEQSDDDEDFGEDGATYHEWFNDDDEGQEHDEGHSSRSCCSWWLWFLKPLPRYRHHYYQLSSTLSPSASRRRTRRIKYPRYIDRKFQETSLHRNCLDVKHCNKFFPFTRKQLQIHDTQTYITIKNIWTKDISNWDDPNDHRYKFYSLPIKWVLNFVNKHFIDKE